MQTSTEFWTEAYEATIDRTDVGVWNGHEWYTALAGEFFEMLSVCQGKQHLDSKVLLGEEIADCMTYASVLHHWAGLSREEENLDPFEDRFIAVTSHWSDRLHNVSEATCLVYLYELMDTIGSNLKEISRNRTGYVASKGVSNEEAYDVIMKALGGLMMNLCHLAWMHNINTREQYARKFNLVSEKMGSRMKIQISD